MRVMIIGIDGGTWDILGPACDKGLMPNLNRFRNEGVYGTLKSTHPPITPPAWTTLMTGMNPGHHGIGGFFEYDPDKKVTKNINSTNIRNETLWHKLARHGKKVVVVGVPMTYPPFEVDGILVSGFETPSTACQFTYPPSFRDEILKEIPQLEFMPPFTRKEKRDVKNFPRYLDWLRDNAEHMLKIFKMGLQKTPWTVSMIVLKSFDELVHHFCRLLDFASDTSNDSRDKQIERYFKELDEAIGELLKLAEQNKAAALIVSDHGGETKTATIYINNILKKLGFLKAIPKWKALFESFKTSEGLNSNPDDRLKIIDYDSTKAFVAGVGIYANLYINKSCKHFDKNYAKEKEDLITELRQNLMKINAADGEKLFTSVIKPTEVYGRDINEEGLPDIMIVPRKGYSINARLDKNKVIEFTGKKSLSGDHSINGMIAMMGSGIATRKKIEADIADITPTILAMLNLPVTNDIDGKIIEVAFTIPLNVKFESPARTTMMGSYSYSKEEQEKINSRLADLGYI
ncbi:MAG: alkaline phosphatase family protein [Phycisphaerae bacterium]|jgi:predicted AlkP superfamily phosphohydrolase/phosphomutase